MEKYEPSKYNTKESIIKQENVSNITEKQREKKSKEWSEKYDLKSNLVQELQEYVTNIKNLSGEDLEILHYLLVKKETEILEMKKKDLINKQENLELRSILWKYLTPEFYSSVQDFKKQELINKFDFKGDQKERDEILNIIKDKESISKSGSNHRGVFELPNNKIVKVLGIGSYAYELPLVKLTKNLYAKNIVKTYDVFTKGDFVYIVQDKAIGKEVNEYTKEEVENIPQEHYDEFVKLVNLYAENGIKTDPSKSSNLFYDKERGFSIIDLGSNYNNRKGSSFYFEIFLSQKKIQESISKYGKSTLKLIAPNIEDKLKILNIQ